jgi:thioredoxin 1
MWTTIILAAVFTGSLAFLVIRAKKRLQSIKDIPDSQKIRVLNDQNFSTIVKKGTVLVDFWAAWCMPCKLMVPVLNEVAEELDGKITVSKLNVDEARKTASQFGIRSIPTMILFRNGKEVKRIVGVKNTEYLLKEIDRAISFS